VSADAWLDWQVRVVSDGQLLKDEHGEVLIAYGRTPEVALTELSDKIDRAVARMETVRDEFARESVRSKMTAAR
jgi:hypothetical protein